MSKLISGAVSDGGANDAPVTVFDAARAALTCREFSMQRDERRFGEASAHEHSATEIGILCGEGVGVLTCFDSSGHVVDHRLVAPVVYVVPARIRHATRWEVRSNIFCAHVEPAFWRRAAFGGHLPPEQPGVARATANDLVLWEFASLLGHVWDERDGTDDRPALWLATSLLIRSSKLMFGEQIPQAPNGTGLSPSRRATLDDFIGRQIRFNLHTADLARAVGLSAPHLTTILKHSTGLTPHEYVTRYRMRKAHQLLASGNYCLREVANAVGYDDPDHFSRKFRVYFGYPPRSLMLRSRNQPANSQGKP